MRSEHDTEKGEHGSEKGAILSSTPPLATIPSEANTPVKKASRAQQ